MYDTSIKSKSAYGLGLVGIGAKILHNDNLQPDFDSMKYESSYVPLCNSIIDGKDDDHMKRAQKLSIDKWQKEKICIYNNQPEDSITRWDLIDTAANQDGGAHIDEKINKKYDNYRYTYSGLSEEFVTKMKNAGQEMINIPVYAMLRQVAFEVLYSIKKTKLIREDQVLAFSWNIDAVKNTIGHLPPDKRQSIIRWSEPLKIFSPEELDHSKTQTYYQRYMKDHQRAMKKLQEDLKISK